MNRKRKFSNLRPSLMKLESVNTNRNPYCSSVTSQPFYTKSNEKKIKCLKICTAQIL